VNDSKRSLNWICFYFHREINSDRVVPKYLNFVTFPNDLLIIFRFFPAFRWWVITGFLYVNV
jgi:hypothetical protein